MFPPSSAISGPGLLGKWRQWRLKGGKTGFSGVIFPWFNRRLTMVWSFRLYCKIMIKPWSNLCIYVFMVIENAVKNMIVHGQIIISYGIGLLGQADVEKHPSVSKKTGTVQNVPARWYLLARNISWPWAPWGLNLVASGAKWVGCRLYILSSNRITSGDQPHQVLPGGFKPSHRHHIKPQGGPP